MNLLQCLKRKINSHFGRKSFALSQLDRKLAPYLSFKEGGFFIEVGANDGIRQSNTLYFEKYYNWTGLLIEPIPELARRCIENRPNCIVENCALVASDYPTGVGEMIYCNLMSVTKGAMPSSAEHLHVKKGEQHLSEGEQVYPIRVPAKTLSGILDEHSIKHINLLSLDVEGYEPQVLRGIDFDRHTPEFMLIEVRDRELVESIIDEYYEPVAALSIKKSYSDMLYRVK